MSETCPECKSINTKNQGKQKVYVGPHYKHVHKYKCLDCGCLFY